MPAPEESRTAVRVLRPPHEPNTIVLVVDGPIPRAALPDLCRRVRAVMEGMDARVLVCDVGGLDRPDAGTVDALARLQLTARRMGRRIRLRRACRDLRDLLALMGLTDVLPASPGLPLEPRRQPEQREPARGVQEEGDPADPTP